MVRKRNILILLVGILSVLGLAGWYTAVAYDVNPIHFLTGANTLSDAERNWLKGRKRLVYGADQNAPPLRYVDAASGQYKGLVLDYIRALSIELETEIELKPLLWSQALEQLARGKTDLCDMFPSEERSQHYLFTDAIYNMRGLVLVPDDAPIQTPEQLSGRRVATPRGDFVIEHLKERVPSTNFLFTADMHAAMSLLKQGRVDAVAGDEPVISHFLDVLDMKGGYHLLDPPLYELGTVLAVPKAREELLHILNKGIRNLKRKQIMAKIQQKWFGISTPLIREKGSEKQLILSLIFLGSIGLTIYLFTTWNQILKKEVHKRTQQLYESQTNLQTTFDSLLYYMVVLDPDWTVVNANRSFCEYAGRPREQVIRQECHRLSPILTNPVCKKMVGQTFAGWLPERGEFTLDNRTYMIRTFPLADQQQQIRNVLCMIKDITQDKENEKRLLHANKMTAVGRLAAGVTHEIRNPLGLIRNHCYLLKKALAGREARHARALEVIEGAVSQANRIIDNLLNFSRISGDQLEKVDIHSMLERMMALQNKALSKKRIRMEIACPPNLNGYLNQEAIGLVLVNLISNAIDAAPEGGRCKLSAWREKEMLVLTCADNGKGIAPDILEHVFEPFFTTKERGAGTGLGLYIAYNQAQKCGGGITVAASPQTGTTFTVQVPLRRDRNDAHNEAEQ